MTIKPSLIFSVRGLGKRLSARSSHIELPNYVEQFVERQAELKKNLLSVEREADKKMGSLFFPRGQPPAPGPQGGGPAKQPRNRPFSYEKVFGFFRARPGGGRGSAGCAPGTGPAQLAPPTPPKKGQKKWRFLVKTCEFLSGIAKIDPKKCPKMTPKWPAYN